MILTELRGYGIAENGISVNSTNKPNQGSLLTGHSFSTRDFMAYILSSSRQ